MSKAIAIVSGGIDSTTMLYKMIEDGYQPIVLTFNYGQRHSIEIEFAEKTARRLNLPWYLHTVQKVEHAGSLEGSAPIPKEDYSIETQKQTVSPNRNMILLSIAAKYAIIHGAETIWYAAHHNDYAVYPDCRPEFVEALNRALEVGNYERVQIIAPFVYMSKAEIVSLGSKLGVPFDLTWSCYDPVEIFDSPIGRFSLPKEQLPHISRENDKFIHCGVCGTCRERIEAFARAKIPDPTRYNILGDDRNEEG